ncbi:MAG: hypothetical protein GXP25_04755 [Planctomycetes bacterium]|nr:hypothetical protein [Planctomycetota bacterium]
MGSHRVHQTLLIEELEERVTPVGLILSAQNPIYRFHDADGDYVMLRFSGPGEAIISGGTEGTNIAGIDFSGTTDKTSFMMKDLNPTGGDNTLTAGADTVQTGDGESLGSFLVIVPKGQFENTNFDIGGNLGKFQAVGNCNDVQLWVDGNLKTANFLGNVDSSMVDAGGMLSTIMVKGDAEDSFIGGEGGVGRVTVNGFLVDSFVFTGQDASFIRVGGGMLWSDMIAMGSIDRVFIGGEMFGGGGPPAFGDPPRIDSGISVGVDLGNVTIKGDMDGAQIAAGENAGVISIGGEMFGSQIMIGGEGRGPNLKGAFDRAPVGPAAGAGNLDKLTISGGMVFSFVSAEGDADFIRLSGVSGEARIYVGGNVGQYQAFGPQFDMMTQIGGNADNVLIKGDPLAISFAVDGNVNRMVITDPVTGGEGIYIGGDLTQGTIDSFDDAGMRVSGNVSKLMIKGPMDNDASLSVGGHTDFLQIGGGILNGSWVDLQRTAGTIQVFGDVEGTEGDAINIGSRLLGSMFIRGDVSGNIDIEGGSRYAPIKIVGDMSGELTGAAFGDVSILGNFTGFIGAEGAGVGNTLLVKGPDTSGDVNPYPEAFNRYIGYEEVV